MFFDDFSLKEFIEALRGVGLTCSLSFDEIKDKVNRLKPASVLHKPAISDYICDIVNTSSQGFTITFTYVYDMRIGFPLEVAYAPERR